MFRLISCSRRCYTSGSKAQLTTMQLIKKLREEIQAPLNLVKSAVSQASPAGDYDSALSILRQEMTKRGEKLVAKSKDRQTPEGWVIAARSADGSSASLAVLNCETDFVAKSEGIIALAQSIGRILADGAAQHQPIGTHIPKTSDEVAALRTGDEGSGSSSSEDTLQERLTQSMSLFGESIKISKAITTRRTPTGNGITSILGIYCHGGPTLGSNTSSTSTSPLSSTPDIYLGRMGALINVSCHTSSPSTSPPTSRATTTATATSFSTREADALAREVVAQNPDSVEELWTLTKVGEGEEGGEGGSAATGRSVRQWIGEAVEIDAWTRFERT